MAQTFWHVRNCSLFQRLSEPLLASLEQRARVRKFPKGTSIYLPTDQADGAFLLADGRVRIGSTTPDGKQCILALVEPGELFGELAVVDSGFREERAEASVNSTVVLLPGDHLRDLMEQSPHLALGITKLIGLRRKRVERRLRSLLFRSNRERLSHLLLELAEQYGKPVAAGLELAIKLSHQDLAAIIGATRETVTTVLGEMQSEGLLQIKRQRLVVRDLQRLAGPNAALPPLSLKSSGNSAPGPLRSLAHKVAPLGEL
ncbi:MAG: Crp/Fnr family transcriptional regulator [Planctomycetales bacterium]|nr:Crp/Fnr family transcriptional regulator [Planctomycetales bacterium]